MIDSGCRYVFATWLLQDGSEEYAPNAPMSEVVGVAKGAEPHKCRFGSDLAERVTSLRVSLHLNLANGALKLGDTRAGHELYGALAAARVARELAPQSVKPLYRMAQAQLALHEFDECKATLLSLLKLEPSNVAARTLLAECSKRRAIEGEAIERRFRGLFSRAHRQGKDLYGELEASLIALGCPLMALRCLPHQVLCPLMTSDCALIASLHQVHEGGDCEDDALGA